MREKGAGRGSRPSLPYRRPISCEAVNPLPPAVWSKGLAYPDYRKTVSRNADTFDEVYAKPAYRAQDLETLGLLPPLRILAIGEDWCPDVYHTLPTWARIADETPGWELRVFPRDAHLEVMDAFLWKDRARRVPVFAFYSAKGSLQVWWSGRGAAAQRFYEGLLAGRSFGDLDKAEIAEFVQSFDKAYRSRFRRGNFAEILALLRAFFHQG